MNQKKFKLGTSIARARVLKARYVYSLKQNSGTVQTLYRRRLLRALLDIKILCRRSISISMYTFNLNSYSNEECLRDFRFLPTELPRTCILLRRLAYPSRWADLEHVFGFHSSRMSEVFYECAESLYKRHGALVTTLRKDLLQSRASLYAEAIHQAGGPLDCCVGFIDGTKLRITRPKGFHLLQRSVYSGHKRQHCYNFQTISTPDGLVFYIYGPMEGRRSDIYLYHVSGLDRLLREYLKIGEKQYCIYGDQAYVHRPWMQVGFKRKYATAEQLEYNNQMNGTRIAVEWSYGEVKASWATLDFSRKMQAQKLPVGLLYIVAVLLRNFKTCLGHTTLSGGHFSCAPPTLEEYVATETE